MDPSPSESAPVSDPVKEYELLVKAVAILSVAAVLLVGFQTVMLFRATGNLDAARTAQEQPVQEGGKLRQQLEALAGRTAKLAQDGNANAKAIVETMRQQGVSLTVPAPNAPPPK